MNKEININSEQISWLPWSVQYFFFIGLAAAALLVAVSYYWFLKDHKYKKKHKIDVEMAAAMVAFVGGIIGPLSLMSELHQPGRFLHFYLYWTPRSWMAIGSLIIPIVSTVSVLYFALLLRARTTVDDMPKLLKILHKGNFRASKVLKPLRFVALFAALAIFIYTGMEVYTVKARVMWHAIAFPILMFLTALVGVFPFLQFILFKETQHLQRLAKLQVTAVISLIVFMVIWMATQSPSAQKVLELMNLNFRWLFLNAVLALLFVTTAGFAFVHIGRKFKLPAIVAQAVSALTLMWFIRWVWVMEVQLLPKFNSTLNDYDLPLGNLGIFSILTSLGVFIILTLLLYVLLNMTGIYSLNNNKINKKEEIDTNENHRKWLSKGILGTGGLLLFGSGFHHTVQEIIHTIINGTSGKKTRDKYVGNANIPEGKIEEEKWTPNQEEYIAFTQCNGCWTQCGIRARVNRNNNKIIRLDGNPYSPLSQTHHFAYQMPLTKAMAELSKNSGVETRSTACSRGAVLHEGVHNKHRILKPMKRVGKRGSGKWESISFEQLVEEVVNGGNLFGEGHVEGLKDIYKPNELIDEKHPSYGAKTNQLFTTYSGPDGRQVWSKRFATNAFGTINFGLHGSYCGLSYRIGSGAMMNDLKKNKHVKPDWDYLKFGLFWGSSPAQAGNPFKRQGRQLAERRIQNDFEYAVVDPAMPNTMALATKNNKWYPIQPGQDSAMAMAMIQYIIKNKRYNEKYLSQPNGEAMKKAGEQSHCNATHLVIVEENHKLYGQFLREKHLKGNDAETTYVLHKETGKLKPNKGSDEAALFGEMEVTLADNSTVKVKTSLSCLEESANKQTMEFYSKQCGISVREIEELAYKFTSYGSQAAVMTHGGMMSGSGVYSALSVLTLNTLIGNMNKKGGVSITGGKFPEFGKGVKYNLGGFPGMTKPKGLPIARSKRRYEDSDEYKEKIAEGKNPYPSKAPWYPFAGGQFTEQISSAVNGYPYKIKAYLNFLANPIYGITGSKTAIVDKLKDPKNIPLFVAVDAYMNDTTALADYIVPDVHNFESWGFSTAWAGVQQKMSTARWPIVDSPIQKDANDETICLESFVIAISKKLGLPGFGDKAMKNEDGTTYDLNKPEDFYLRAAANIAFVGKKPVADVDENELKMTGVDRIMPLLENVLKPDEVKKVAQVFVRGGRFAPHKSGWDKEIPDATGPKWKPTLQIWNESIGKNKNSFTGKHYLGCATYIPPVFANGQAVDDFYPKSKWPLRMISVKSNIMSSSSIHLERLRTIRKGNIVAINPEDAKKFGVQHGEEVILKTPSGEHSCVIATLNGVTKGVISVEHGWGHTGFGATKQILDGKEFLHDEKTGSGFNMNELGIKDPSRTEIESPWYEWMSGSSVRQGLPATIERI